MGIRSVLHDVELARSSPCAQQSLLLRQVGHMPEVLSSWPQHFSRFLICFALATATALFGHAAPLLSFPLYCQRHPAESCIFWGAGSQRELCGRGISGLQLQLHKGGRDARSGSAEVAGQLNGHRNTATISPTGHQTKHHSAWLASSATACGRHFTSKPCGCSSQCRCYTA